MMRVLWTDEIKNNKWLIFLSLSPIMKKFLMHMLRHGNVKLEIQDTVSPAMVIVIPGWTIKMIIPAVIRARDDHVSIDGTLLLSKVADNIDVHKGSPVFKICAIVDPIIQ